MSNRYESGSKMSADDYKTYGETRRERYPTTYRDKHPSAEAERDYDRYTQRKLEANESESQYWKGYKKHAGSREVPIETLSQRQHGSLVLPAAEVATDTLTHAQARNSFLEDHPYAYRNGRTRRTHEDYADSAYEDAAYYRDRYATHQSGSTKSSSSAPTGAEEPYWQLNQTTGQYYHRDRDGTVTWKGPGGHSSSSAAPRR